MNIINKVKEESYIQWIENFVKRVIDTSGIECNEVVIVDIEFSKRIFITIDGKDYDIRTWNFHTIAVDEKGDSCAEIVRYTLFKMIWNEDGSGHGEEINNGTLRIQWKN